MDAKLIDALKERIREGYSETSILEEMIGVGYPAEQARAAYEVAKVATISVGQDTVLPDTASFLKSVWNLFLSELSLLGKTFLIGVAAFVLVATGVFVLANTVGLGVRDSFLMTAVIVPVSALLTGGAMYFALMRALLLRTTQALFRTHVIFVVTHIFSIALVTIYLTILTQVGYAFFVIPGIMAAFYLMFALPVLLVGELKGMGAILESVRLVYGRFFSVLWRILVVNLMATVGVFLLTLIFSFFVISVLSEDSVFGLAVFPLLFVLVIGVVVASVYYVSCGTVVLYETLKRTPASEVPSVKFMSQLKVFLYIVIGVVVALLSGLSFMLGFAGYHLFA